jgi:hypothetical protein
MLNVKPLSQRDPRWAEKCVGFSRLKFKSVGCTITAITCLLNFLGYEETPDSVNDKLKKLGEYDAKSNPGGAFLGALVVWKNIPLVFPKLFWTKSGRAYNYSNFPVALSCYTKKMPVMVEVNAAKIGAAKHWVLFCGWGKMVDPWWGDIRSTREYPTTGYALYEKR